MGVNGAKSTNEMKNMLAVARNPDNDFPVIPNYIIILYIF